MSALSDTAEFHRRLTSAFDQFRQNEKLHRQQFERQRESLTDKAQAERLTTELLERTTRRFLIDECLRALGWEPDDPDRVVEEARNPGDKGEYVYFDYLGLAPHTRWPVLLVEAKGYDAAPVRKRRGDIPDAPAMAALLAKTLNGLKASIPKEKLEITSQWVEWLSDLRAYVGGWERKGKPRCAERSLRQANGLSSLSIPSQR